MKKDAIIFDLNGVLIWDTFLHEKAWRTYAKQFRQKELTNEEMHLHVHGQTNKYVIEYLLGKTISEKEAVMHMMKKEELYREMCMEAGDGFGLAPGAEELLNNIVVRNIPHTIATSSEIHNLKFFFEQLHLDRWFRIEEVAYNDDIVLGKPAPDIYLRAASFLKIEPEKCVVIEDSLPGIQSAHRAGIGYIIAIGSKEQRDRLAEMQGVDLVISTFSEFPIGNIF